MTAPLEGIEGKEIGIGVFSLARIRYDKSKSKDRTAEANYDEELKISY
jgi:hypothetical protein